jgi:pyruvate/2-oxoglutarate dehydrogenase complex dihydrolipoamide acyltransferase (E2) component
LGHRIASLSWRRQQNDLDVRRQSMRVDIIMPQLGESVVEGTITKWLVKAGDLVKRDQAVVEVATDKADSEVPSPQAGRIAELLVEEGVTIACGAVLCRLETDVGAGAEPSALPRAAAPAVAAPAAAPVASTPTALPTTAKEFEGEADHLRRALTSSEPIEHSHSQLSDDQTFAPRGAERVIPPPVIGGTVTTANWQPPLRKPQAPAHSKDAVTPSCQRFVACPRTRYRSSA